MSWSCPQFRKGQLTTANLLLLIVFEKSSSVCGFPRRELCRGRGVSLGNSMRGFSFITSNWAGVLSISDSRVLMRPTLARWRSLLAPPVRAHAHTHTNTHTHTHTRAHTHTFTTPLTHKPNHPSTPTCNGAFACHTMTFFSSSYNVFFCHTMALSLVNVCHGRGREREKEIESE